MVISQRALLHDEYFCPPAFLFGLPPPLVLALSLGPFPDSAELPPLSSFGFPLLTPWFAGDMERGLES